MKSDIEICREYKEKLYNYKKEHNTLNDIMYVENGTLLDKLKKG